LPVSSSTPDSVMSNVCSNCALSTSVQREGECGRVQEGRQVGGENEQQGESNDEKRAQASGVRIRLHTCMTHHCCHTTHTLLTPLLRNA